MKLGLLFSGGKDSTYAGYLAKKYGHNVACLISIVSENKESYMFHTPTISLTERQSGLMNLPIIIQNTKGEKELELGDLESAIKKAIDKYKIEGVVSGAVESIYQATRVQQICSKLGIECFNPLWQKNQIDLLNELIKNNFEVIVTGVFAYPFDKSWVGKKIDKKFVEEISKLKEEYQINPAGEGGEFETLVVDCPLFSQPLQIYSMEVFGDKNSYTMEVK
jgi:diphthine-ammonia ligase